MYKLTLKHCLFSLLFLLAIISACKKDVKEPVKSTDKWVSEKLVDSVGNKYFIANTLNKKLEIRIENNKGELIFSKECPTIDSTEIPISAEKVSMTLSIPNKYISKNDVSLALFLVTKMDDNHREYVQLLANINLETKAFYTNKYKVDDPSDWTFVIFNDAVAPWYQNTILVREGSDGDVYGGGGSMGLGARGTQIVCYNRDFSVRYTKDIDASAAYYFKSDGTYIPISNTDRIRFDVNDGKFSRLALVVSREDEWAGVKPLVWQVDLKSFHKLPQDYWVKITDYNVTGDLVGTEYSIYDQIGKLVSKESKVWDLKTGMPK